MYVVASLLNPAATHQTQEIWQLLEHQCGLAGIKLTPLPHFSWQASEEFHLGRVEEALQRIAEHTSPFTIQTAGLGIFTGANPILYLSLSKSRKLMEIHEEIWREVMPAAVNPNMYYAPGSWIPHITLAYRDVTPENLACAIQNLAFQKTSLEVMVDHFALIYAVDGQLGIKFRYDFRG
jgi:2'-5' RNA ligase